ncbi:MAG: MFS transporter [Bradyrhizobium sp.]|uniref:MFS transporter n=1 Tax=Bradyrhizobium sp. TaxID=376 RepID=UPI001DE8D3FC|nr:MFS transporter [Bradyrhizobium sp.]MBV9565157.1 MFS transporter [Bradyrhizobium sp.]
MKGDACAAPLAPFRIRNYRFLWPSDLLTSWAFEMEAQVLGWYIVVETGSVVLLTLLASLTYVGTLIAPLFGVIGDRIGHRDLLGLMRASYAVCSGVLMLLALTHRLTPTVVIVTVAIMGMVRPSDLGVRGALVADIMPPELLVGAISVSRTTMDTARIAGALTGTGLFALLGIGPAYVAVVALYLAATALTFCVVGPPNPHLSAPGADAGLPRSPLRDLKEGVAYIRGMPRMQAALSIAFITNLTAYPTTNGLLPYVAREIYGTDQTGLGYISASFAAGSLIGAIVLMLAGNGVRMARLLIGTSMAWYVMLLAFAQMQTLRAGMACLVLTGIAQGMSMILVTVILMRGASAHIRGRVMGVRMMVIYGLPLGLLVAGSLIDRIGFVATSTLYAGSGLVLMAVIALRWRADLWPVHAPANAR